MRVAFFNGFKCKYKPNFNHFLTQRVRSVKHEVSLHVEWGVVHCGLHALLRTDILCLWLLLFYPSQWDLFCGLVFNKKKDQSVRCLSFHLKHRLPHCFLVLACICTSDVLINSKALAYSEQSYASGIWIASPGLYSVSVWFLFFHLI